MFPRKERTFVTRSDPWRPPRIRGVIKKGSGNNENLYAEDSYHLGLEKSSHPQIKELKFQAPNHKSQINFKFQCQMTETIFLCFGI
jgi:hypothetical protein